MSTVRLTTSTDEPTADEVVAQFVFDDFLDTATAAVAVGARSEGFTAKVGQTMWHHDDASHLYVGLGAAHALDAEQLRRAAAALIRVARSTAALVIDIRGLVVNGLDHHVIAQTVGEGAMLGAYRFDAEKKATPDETVGSVRILGGTNIADAVNRATTIGEAVCCARDLINTPPSSLNPERFATVAAALGSEFGLVIEVLDEAALEAGEYGGVLGVSRGSAASPRFVRATYEPQQGADTTIALVGKGVTFDSGGLSLKPADGMMTMKTDMSGAAAVLATMVAASRLQLSIRIVGYMPLVENMPGGGAIKPGDVLRAKNGKTIEVLNTDAEGRLILADALSEASAASPDAIIDLATLTGACVQALGTGIAGIIGNDDRLIEAVREAAKRAGEPMWPLPLPAGYRSALESDVADMRNIATPGVAGGALTAGLILEEFVGDTPWVHLDIAGPARSGDDKGYIRKGGTGFGVRTLLQLLEQYVPLGGAAAGAAGKVVLR